MRRLSLLPFPKNTSSKIVAITNSIRSQSSYSYYYEGASGNSSSKGNKIKHKIPGVEYDEETNTTIIHNKNKNANNSDGNDNNNSNDEVDDDIAKVITASFGVQQNIRPSWSWEQQQEQQNTNEEEKENNDHLSSSSSSLNKNEKKDSLLPQIHKQTEGEISQKDNNSDNGNITEQQERLKNELVEELKRKVPPTTTPQEDFMLEFQRFYYKNKTQVGPYIGSTPLEEGKRLSGGGGEEDGNSSGGIALALRQRREIERVPKWEPPFEATETSFRRLPPSIKLPSERELRFIYPMKTDLPIEWQRAHCADFNMVDIEDDPSPMKYGILKPKNYDPRKPHPVMVWISDHRGEEVDFEDSCAHLFQRGPHYESWYENGWLILAPVISVRHAQLHAQEGVIARFCDWVCQNYNVEHGRVHLAGKGLGGFAALRTVLEMKQLAISCTALLGRLAGAYRPLERPQDKAANVHGTHVLMFVPGDMKLTSYVYKFKGFCDLARVSPPVRAIHFADVRDHQVYYAVNPNEFWNYMEFFRTNNLHSSPVLKKNDDE